MTDLDKVLEAAKDIQHGGLMGRRAREKLGSWSCTCLVVVDNTFAALLCQYHLQSGLHIGVLLVEAAARSFAKKSSSTGRSQVQRRHITCLAGYGSCTDLAVLQRRYLIIMLVGGQKRAAHSLTVCVCVYRQRRPKEWRGSAPAEQHGGRAHRTFKTATRGRRRQTHPRDTRADESTPKCTGRAAKEREREKATKSSSPVRPPPTHNFYFCCSV